MVKIDLGKCCMNCDHSKLASHNFARGYREDEYGRLETLRDVRVYCENQGMCREFFQESICASPVEELFND